MLHSVSIGDHKIKIGTVLFANRRAEDCGICSEGTKVSVHLIKRDGVVIFLGLRSDEYVSGWHDLLGTVDKGHGQWQTMDDFMKNFVLQEVKYEIVNTKFRGKDLSGKACKLITHAHGNRYAFIELDENIGGGSADGLGRGGHCIVVKPSQIKISDSSSVSWKKSKTKGKQ